MLTIMKKKVYASPNVQISGMMTMSFICVSLGDPVGDGGVSSSIPGGEGGGGGFPLGD